MIAALRAVGDDALSRAVLFRFTWTDIVFWALGAAYFVLLTAMTGATPGKKAMGLTVVNELGERPDLMTALCRETWARYLSSILCIGYILCALDPERGALHDRICGTRVIWSSRREDRTAPPVRQYSPVPDRSPAALPPADDWYAPNMERR